MVTEVSTGVWILSKFKPSREGLKKRRDITMGLLHSPSDCNWSQKKYLSHWQYLKNNKTKWRTRAPTHGLVSSLCMRTAISPGKWQPWTADMKLGQSLCTLPFTAEAGAEHPFKHQLYTTHVGASGWEPPGSSPTAIKADPPSQSMLWENCRVISLYACVGTGQTVGWCSSVSLAFIVFFGNISRPG